MTPSSVPSPASLIGVATSRGGRRRGVSRRVSVTRRELAVLAVRAANLAARFGAQPRKLRAQRRGLRLIARSDRRVLDPIWTTAYVTCNHWDRSLTMAER
jgi:hypothetical protein